MDLERQVRQLLTEIGPGRSISPAAYDTAWAARLVELEPRLGMEALEWLRAHQLTDGSWGAPEPRYYHDRLICTLAAMTALARERNACDELRIERARASVGPLVQGLSSDPAGETIGFEMIVPTLLAEARDLGLIHNSAAAALDHLTHYRKVKLSALPKRVISRHVTVAFSSEMAGLDGRDLLDVEHLQEPDGSIAYSPAATAYFARYVDPGSRDAMAYLRNAAIDGGSLPDVAPFNVFEPGWVLWNLALTGALGDGLLTLCEPHLDRLEGEWDVETGVGFAAGYPAKDSDETGLVYDVLARFGRNVDLRAVMGYEEEHHYRCFHFEANPSISANIHILGALLQAGLPVSHPSVHKVIDFLRRVRTGNMFWLDKWHASPYYPTAHAVVIAAGRDNTLIDDAVYWMQMTQNENGSWGYYMPTAEETAYCVQALVSWKRCGKHVPKDALTRAVEWLQEHLEPPYPPLWIGKCLYSPQLVVRSAIVSALLLALEE